MSATAPDRDRLLEFLLGELSPREQEAVESEIFGSDDVFEAALAAEDDLIDAYAAGDLDAGRQRRFEERYGSHPEHRDRLVFARALSMLPPAKAARPRRWLVAAAGLAAAALAAGWWIDAARTRASLQALRAQEHALRSRAAASERRVEELQQELQRTPPDASRAESPEERGLRELLSSRGSPVRIATLALGAGLERGEEPAPAVRLGADTALLRLEMSLPKRAHPSYRVGVETAEGRLAWSVAGLAAWSHGGQSGTSALVPARTLRPGTYVAIVRGELPGGRTEEVAAFSFRVLRTD